MICPNCGTILPDDSAFCPECGSRIIPSATDALGDESVPLSGSARNAQHEDANKNMRIGMAVTVVVAALIVIGIILAIAILPGFIQSLTGGGR